MTSATLLDEIKKLSTDEKIHIVEEVWDDILVNDTTISYPSPEINEEHKRIISERYKEHLKNPDEGDTMNEVRAKFHTRMKKKNVRLQTY